MTFQGHADQRYGHITYSHCGEDLMVVNLFELMGIEKPTYLDIGAHHPFNISNTALLYSRGSRGINIEANPNLMQEFYNHRLEDININIGIGRAPGLEKFYMWDETSGRNTFNPEWAEKLQVKGGHMNLLVTTLNIIIQTICHGTFPDFLNIDIEGLDYEVLSSYDFSVTAPKIICVETNDENREDFKKMLDEKGYFLYSRHNIDLIFVKKEYRDKVC